MIVSDGLGTRGEGEKKIESYLALGLNELVDRPFSETEILQKCRF